MKHLTKFTTALAFIAAIVFSSCSHKMAVNSSKKMETQASLSNGEKGKTNSVSKPEQITDEADKRALAEKNADQKQQQNAKIKITEPAAITSPSSVGSHKSRDKKASKSLKITLPAISLVHSSTVVKKTSVTKSNDRNLKLALIFLIMGVIFSFIIWIVAVIFYVLFAVFFLFWLLSM